jgi:hydroxyethylthiazole kinase-like uncharacterized protein yjeF
LFSSDLSVCDVLSNKVSQKPMKIVTTAQMRAIDERSIRKFGIAGKILMERAGAGVVKVVRDVLRMGGVGDPLVRVVAGKGNNGGDGFVVARRLKQHGMRVDVRLACSVEAIKGDALIHFEKMTAAGVKFLELSSEQDWEEESPAWEQVDLIVDALLGTGISGPAHGVAARAIRSINLAAGKRPVVAVDIPSGLNSDTGEAEGDAVIADITATMGLPKCGLVQACALNHVGSLEVVDIGIPREVIKEAEGQGEVPTARDVSSFFSRRDRSAHKGTFGHALLIGGAAGYAGAVAMAAKAAVRSGVGLVTCLVPGNIASTVTSMVPEAMVHGGVETDTGCLASTCLKSWARDLKDFSAVLVGPGMTTHSDVALLVRQIMSESKGPLIMDADALNVCAGQTEVIFGSSCPVLITPHPGEMARLLECTTEDIQRDRAGTASGAAERLGVTVVLKGAGTVIAGEGRSININMTGNPGMAKGGTGDVLAGLTTGLAAQGLGLFNAALAGVYIHGRAGDRAALTSSQAGMTASDLIEELPWVFRELMCVD